MTCSKIFRTCSLLIAAAVLTGGCRRPPVYISAEKVVVILEKDSSDPMIFRVIDGTYLKEDGELRANPDKLRDFSKGLPEKVIGLSQSMYLHLRERAAEAKRLESIDG